MEPVHFHKDVEMLKGYGNVVDLPILKVHYEDYGNGLMSCWQLTWREWFQLLIGRRVYLVVLGDYWPPVALSSDSGIDDNSIIKKLKWFNLHPGFIHLAGLRIKLFNAFNRVCKGGDHYFGFGLLQINGHHLFFWGTGGLHILFFKIYESDY